MCVCEHDIHFTKPGQMTREGSLWDRALWRILMLLPLSSATWKSSRWWMAASVGLSCQYTLELLRRKRLSALWSSPAALARCVCLDSNTVSGLSCHGTTPQGMGMSDQDNYIQDANFQEFSWVYNWSPHYRVEFLGENLSFGGRSHDITSSLSSLNPSQALPPNLQEYPKSDSATLILLYTVVLAGSHNVYVIPLGEFSRPQYVSNSSYVLMIRLHFSDEIKENNHLSTYQTDLNGYLLCWRN